MKKKVILAIFSFFVAICTLDVIIALRLTPITLKREIFVYEFGNEISTDVATYINANDTVLKQAKLNFSNVKNEIGIYQASVEYAGSKYDFYIKIEDTTKPIVKLKQIVFNVNPGETIQAYDLLESVQDQSKIKAYFLLDNGKKETQQTFNENGSYVMNILVVDAAGNQAAKLRVKIVVGHHGNYPTLLGITDIEIKKGEKFDPMAGVSASDGNGNDITSRIQILKNNVKYDKEGVYEVIYSVKNDNGNTLQRTRKVEVIKNESEKKS